MKDIKELGKEYVRCNYGEQFVSEFIEMYDKLSCGESIGGLIETIGFLELLDTISKSTEKSAFQCKDCKWLEPSHMFNHDCHICKNPNRNRYFSTKKSIDVKYPSQRACKTGFELKDHN